MKKFKYLLHLPLLLLVALSSSCNFAGLELQKKAEFEDIEVNQYIDMTAWEYIQSRPDVFYSLAQAIEYCGLQEEFSKPDRTYLLPTNNALSSSTNTRSYFRENRLPNPEFDPSLPVSSDNLETFIPVSWTVYDKAEVAKFLKYHITLQPVTIFELKDSKTWMKTAAYENAGDTYLVCGEWTRDRYCKLYFNAFPGHRQNDELKLGALTTIQPRISNIKCKGNSAIHVMDSYLVPPTAAMLDNYNVEY